MEWPISQFNMVVKSEPKYVVTLFNAHWIYKNYSKWNPPCSIHNSQSCDTAVQTDWHNFVWA